MSDLRREIQRLEKEGYVQSVSVEGAPRWSVKTNTLIAISTLLLAWVTIIVGLVFTHEPDKGKEVSLHDIADQFLNTKPRLVTSGKPITKEDIENSVPLKEWAEIQQAKLKADPDYSKLLAASHAQHFSQVLTLALRCGKGIHIRRLRAVVLA